MPLTCWRTNFSVAVIDASLSTHFFDAGALGLERRIDKTLGTHEAGRLAAAGGSIHERAPGEQRFPVRNRPTDRPTLVGTPPSCPLARAVAREAGQDPSPRRDP
jgi:hypothetical protein